MNTINYNHRFFRSVSNTENGEVNAETIFHYRQAGSSLWATYQGGPIRFGALVGSVQPNGTLEFRYQHLNQDGATMMGACRSQPEHLPDGRLRLHEKWQWLSGDQSHGESIVEEVRYPVDIAEAPNVSPLPNQPDQAPYHTVSQGDFTISTDPARLDPEAIHAFLSQAYWAPGRPFHIVTHTLNNSLCFGLYYNRTQVGLARVITDYAVFAYLCDVYVLEEHRGRGLGKWLLQTVLDYPPLRHVLRWTLATQDAHSLYTQFGFTPLASPATQMELRRPIAWE